VRNDIYTRYSSYDANCRREGVNKITIPKNMMPVVFALLYILISLFCTNGIIMLGVFLVCLISMMLLKYNYDSMLLFICVLLINSKVTALDTFLGASLTLIIHSISSMIILMKYLRSKVKTSTSLVSIKYYFVVLLYYIGSCLYFRSPITTFITILFIMILSYAMQGVASEKSAEVVKVFYYSILIMCVIAYIELIIGQTFFYSRWISESRYRYNILRVGSTVADPNFLATLLVVSLCLFQTRAFKDIIGKKRIRLVSMLMILMIVLTTSRTALITLALVFVFIIALEYKPIILILFPILLFLLPNIFSIFDNMISNSFVESTNFRNYVVGTSLSLWYQNPIFGLGWGSGLSNLRAILGDTTDTMNTYIYLLLSGGVVSLISYVFYIIMLVKNYIIKLLRMGKGDSIYIVAAMIAWSIMAYSLDLYYMFFLWFFPAILIAVNVYEKSDKIINKT